MEVATGSYLPPNPKFRRSSPKTAAQLNRATASPPPPPPPPVFISTNPGHVNLDHLQDLYTLCNHSCHRFPALDAAGRLVPVAIPKLRTALSHSTVVVSAFTKAEFVVDQSSGGDWVRKIIPVNPENGRLIGFGRAVSDLGLTASIYDVMVHPALQRRGIGTRILKRIIGILTQRDIYDISALCAATERLFFGTCGFEEDDKMGSTAMMYMRSGLSNSEDEQTMHAGQMQLLVPPVRDNL